jgi:hypothetical protein
MFGTYLHSQGISVLHVTHTLYAPSAKKKGKYKHRGNTDSAPPLIAIARIAVALVVIFEHTFARLPHFPGGYGMLALLAYPSCFVGNTSDGPTIATPFGVTQFARYKSQEKDKPNMGPSYQEKVAIAVACLRNSVLLASIAPCCLQRNHVPLAFAFAIAVATFRHQGTDATLALIAPYSRRRSYVLLAFAFAFAIAVAVAYTLCRVPNDLSSHRQVLPQATQHHRHSSPRTGGN